MAGKGKVLVIGCDHAGVNLKLAILKSLQHEFPGVEVIDVGSFDRESCDYPVIAQLAVDKVKEGEADCAILICGTGVNMCMAANRFSGIRALVGTDVGIVKLAREQNNANVLCLGGVVGPSMHQVKEMIYTFLYTNFSMSSRHIRRIQQMEMFIPGPCGAETADDVPSIPTSIFAGGTLKPRGDGDE